MHALLPSVTLGIAGIVLILALSLAPRADTLALAVATPFWSPPDAALRAAVRLDLAVVDLRLSGKLVLLRPQDGAAGDPRILAAALRRHLPAGSLVIGANAGLCTPRGSRARE